MIVIITVDVEGAHSRTPMDSMIYGKLGTEEFGLKKIMDLCDHFQVKGSFFVDVYEYALHGRTKMREVVEYIVDRKHDIQLHSHPAWPLDSRDEFYVQQWKKNNCLYDSQRPWMYQYDLEEQIEILHHGKEMLEQWAGSKIIAHRAGGYGVNTNTLAAAREVGLKVDLSAFRGHSNCHLKTGANAINIIEGIIEVPVTGFFRPRYARFPRLPFKRRFVKTDIDWALLDELKFFYEDGEKNGLNLMVLFMHSYSFIALSPKFDHFEANYNDLRRFELFLEWSRQRDAEFITVQDFWHQYAVDKDKFCGCDYIPAYTEYRMRIQ